MLLTLSSVIFLLPASIAFPENINLPKLKDFSPPEEVNAALQNNQNKRSISNHGGVDNTEDTIREVERLIQANPQLPRLTRGEILDILDNITKQDEKSKHSIRDPKALMIVKAYTPPMDLGQVNVEELYTKPPVTSIVKEKEDYLTDVPQRIDSKTTESSIYFRRKPTKSFDDKKSINTARKKPSRGNIQFKMTTTGEPPSVTRGRITLTSTTAVPFSTRRDIKRRRRPLVSISSTTTTTTSMPVTTYRPRSRPSHRQEPNYSSYQKVENNSFRRPTYPPEGIRIIPPPVTPQAPSEFNGDLEDLLPQEMKNEESIVQPSAHFEIPNHIKQIMENLNVFGLKDSGPSSMNNNVEVDRMKSLLGTLKKESTTTTTTTTTTELPNALAVVDNLSPDMKELLKNFGLLPDPNEITKNVATPSFNPETAIIDPNSYNGFKPLPEDRKTRLEMEQILSQFGLLNENSRQSKGANLNKEHRIKTNVTADQISLEAIPDHLKPLLHDMGFSLRTSRKIRQQPKNENDLNSSQEHVFNPAKIVSEEELKKLEKLLEVMKRLEKLNGTVTEDTMDNSDKTTLKELLSSLNQMNVVPLNDQEAPNPVEFDEGLNKTEVKRQKNEETVTATVILSEETKTPSLKDLEDSFGGPTETATVALPEPTTRRNGFYYLLDWNTFFEIDDQKGKRVNLRFQPKVGDPKRFFNVKIP
ncbi:hypothetical protein ABEB36_005014 [Hypothenemus hampei]|uniref:Uncharacterized protein n=1 Tax=Hypothenemus hampei TaxID=57062 RepID=A0ABD1EWM7_HYPHA